MQSAHAVNVALFCYGIKTDASMTVYCMKIVRGMVTTYYIDYTYTVRNHVLGPNASFRTTLHALYRHALYA